MRLAVTTALLAAFCGCSDRSEESSQDAQVRPVSPVVSVETSVPAKGGSGFPDHTRGPFAQRVDLSDSSNVRLIETHPSVESERQAQFQLAIVRMELIRCGKLTKDATGTFPQGTVGVESRARPDSLPAISIVSRSAAWQASATPETEQCLIESMKREYLSGLISYRVSWLFGAGAPT